MKSILSCFILLGLFACKDRAQEERFQKAAERQEQEQQEEAKTEFLTDAEEEPETTTAVTALKNFRRLYIESKWDSAAAYADSASVNFFTRTIKLAKTADSLTLSKETIATRFYTVYIRHRFAWPEMKTLTTPRLLAYILENGVIINQSIAEAGDHFDHLTMADEERVCGTLEKTLNIICLNKENGRWLMSFTHFFDRQVESLKAGAQYREIHVNDHMKYAMAEITNYAEAKNPLWKKPGSK